MTKEQLIEKYMKNLGLTREEAEQMWKDEQEDNLPDLTDEQKAVVKKMAQGDRKKEQGKRNYIRSPDEAKRKLIQGLTTYLSTFSDEIEGVSIENPEREINFIFQKVQYRLTLSKPRK